MEPDGHGGRTPKPKINEATGRQEDPLGFITLASPSLAEKLRQPGNWWSIIGVIGLLIAFGHSILAMSGEETLAQVYREVESPKLPNFKKAAFIVFVYSLVLTAGISFLAVLLIPDEVRMKIYSDNLIGGLAMHVSNTALPLRLPSAPLRIAQHQRRLSEQRRSCWTCSVASVEWDHRSGPLPRCRSASCSCASPIFTSRSSSSTTNRWSETLTS